MSKQAERVVLHHYKAAARTWSKSIAQVVIANQPVAQGAFRTAHRGSLLTRSASDQKEDTKRKAKDVICKFAKASNTPKSLYYHDVEAQVYASIWAQKYNSNDPPPPKRVSFVTAYVLELAQRPGRPLCGCEDYIRGEFRKHNNNVGAVCAVADPNDPEAVLDNNTAQAFSHFTYEASNHTLLICDIQGFSGLYTDPQIHTLSGKQFGSGNLGVTGIRAFLLRHVCNSVCKAMNLPLIKATTVSKGLGMALEDQSRQQRSSRRPSKHLPYSDTGAGSTNVAAVNSPPQPLVSRPRQIKTKNISGYDNWRPPYSTSSTSTSSASTSSSSSSSQQPRPKASSPQYGGAFDWNQHKPLNSHLAVTRQSANHFTKSLPSTPITTPVITPNISPDWSPSATLQSAPVLHTTSEPWSGKVTSSSSRSRHSGPHATRASQPSSSSIPTSRPHGAGHRQTRLAVPNANDSPQPSSVFDESDEFLMEAILSSDHA